MLKLGRKLVGSGILLLAVTRFAHAQQAADAPPADAPAPAAVPGEVIDQGPLIAVDPVQAAAESTTGRWGIDPVTWEVVGPPEDAEALALYNSPDQTESRRLASLAFTDPDEYLRLFPKTPEQLAAEAQAEFEITHPKTYAEHRASQTPEQNAAEDALVASLLKAFSGTISPPDPAPPSPSPNSDTAPAPAPDASAPPSSDANNAAPATSNNNP